MLELNKFKNVLIGVCLLYPTIHRLMLAKLCFYNLRKETCDLMEIKVVVSNMRWSSNE